MSIAFAVVLGMLIWALNQSELRRLRESLSADSDIAQEAIIRQLNGNRDYLLLLADEMAGGTLDEESFQERVSQYVSDNPELINVTWADEDFVIRWTAPYEPNKQVIGLSLSLPEPERASSLARDTRAPVYTKIFEVIQGKAAFEIYVPVFRGDTFIGTFGGIYAVGNILRYALPQRLSESYKVSFLNNRGTVVASLWNSQPTDNRLTQVITLEPLGFGTVLRLNRYRSSWTLLVSLLTALVVTLAIGMAWSMWKLVQDISKRRRVETALFEEKERAQVTLHSIGDAVITMDDQRFVEYVNPVAEKLTGWTANEARGQSITSVFKIIDEKNRTPVLSPIDRCLKEGTTAEPRNHTILISRSGHEYSIQHSTAPIWSLKHEFLGVVLVFSDVTESHRIAQEISYQATHDALTGLVNRREFEQRLQRVLKTRAIKTAHVLCYLDLDQFKIINDTCGHAAGDELLRQLAGLLKAKVRTRDTLARLGGDEFGVLMEHCRLEQGLRVAEALRRAVEDFRFLWEGRSFSVGASIGLVPITESSESVSAVLRASDRACYAAKEKGRNRIHVYRENDVELAKRQGEIQWVARIPWALEENRFQLSFQPIVRINNMKDGIGHYELLLRMKDEQGHTIPPGAFLPAAERYDLVAKIDRWVIARALTWLTRHPAHLERLFLCAINLSGHSLGNYDFLTFIVRQFNDTGVPPEKICFEITETAAIVNLTEASQFIKALAGKGCRFALDDFGSGLSSFAYLKNLPVDFLKIDGTFVKDIIDDPIDLAMVKSINEMGKVMGKETIAEFVENDAILEKLREIGVDYAQGNGISRPRPIDDMVL